MKKLPLILLLVALAGFMFGLAQLLKLRFDSGDVYPPYSSLRADPLGTKALFESFDRLVPTARHYQDLSKLGDGRDVTLLYLGEEARKLRFLAAEFRQFESFTGAGGRLVISLFPAYERPSTNRFLPGPAPARANPPPGGGDKTEREPKKKAPANPEDFFADARTISIKERWGLGFDFAALPKGESGAHEPETAYRQMASALPEKISCHTALFFDSLDKSWRVIYERKKDRPVMIERDFGRGTIVLCADSYLFSNEALLRERQPELLSWLVGGSRRVTFDETHLGVEQSPGIVALARNYHLHGLFAGLLLLAGLFIWKNSAGFLPPHPEDVARDHGDVVSGRESAAGFVNLLRRNISARELLGVCILEWRKTCKQGTPAARLQQMQSLIDAENALPPERRNPVRTYRALSGILKARSEFRVSSSGLKPGGGPSQSQL